MAPNVLLLSTDVSPTSGWGTVTHAICSALDRTDGFSFNVLLPERSGGADAVPFAEHALRLLPSLDPSRIAFGRRPDRALAFLNPRVRVPSMDIVHAVVEFPYAILARALARRARVPYVVSLHGTYAVAPFRRRVDAFFYRRALRDADLVTAPSQFTADAAQEASGVIRDIEVIHDPVDLTLADGPIDQAAVRRRLDLPADARVVLGVGAIKSRKGFDLLVAAFAEVVARIPSAYLVIAGEGDTRPLQAQAGSLGVGERARIVGAVSHEHLRALYQTCELFVLLPRYEQDHFEGFGIVYLEAGVFGKPVVGARSGGVGEAVRDGETGILVPEGDAPAAAAAIIRLMTEPGLADRLGRGGRAWAERHGVLPFAQPLLDAYRRLHGRSHRG